MGIPSCSSKQLIKALQKVGFAVNYKCGDGSLTQKLPTPKPAIPPLFLKAKTYLLLEIK